VLNGNQTDESNFRSEVKDIFAYTKKDHTEQKDVKPIVTGTKADATYLDVQKTVGIVPGFVRDYPEEGIAGAWLELKNLQMNPHTAIPGKYKEMIGLAVSAQIPCRFCTVFHTEALRNAGATDREIREAVAVASEVRHWSTFLNGISMDEATFKKELAQMFAHMKKQARHASADKSESDSTVQ
jgi:AhpD family alkylhydroperoxidase